MAVTLMSTESLKGLWSRRGLKNTALAPRGRGAPALFPERKHPALVPPLQLAHDVDNDEYRQLQLVYVDNLYLSIDILVLQPYNSMAWL